MTENVLELVVQLLPETETVADPAVVPANSVAAVPDAPLSDPLPLIDQEVP